MSRSGRPEGTCKGLKDEFGTKIRVLAKASKEGGEENDLKIDKEEGGGDENRS